MKKNLLLSIALVFAFISWISAQPGTLDNSFGIDGKVTTEFNNGYFFPVFANIQSNGKVLVAGNVWGYMSSGFKVVQYDTDGTLDNDFGFELTGASASAFTIQPDGKYLLSGPDLRRYDADGNIDTGFGNAGATDLNFNVTCMVLQPDEKIIVAGDNGNDFVLTRFHANGLKDNDFGVNGMVTTDFGSSDEEISAIAIQSDLKIVVAGYSKSSTHYDFALARYNPDGSLDNSFNTDGKVTTDFAGEYDKANAMAIQPDGKIVLAGVSRDSLYNNFALARYDTEGNLDVNFGTDGKVTTNFEDSGSEGISISMQAGGKIVVAGNTGNDFAVARYDTDGTLDHSFDDDGKTITDIANRYDFAETMATGTGGEIIIVGTSDFDFALVKYNVDGNLDPSFSDDGIVTFTLGRSVEIANSLAIQPNGKIVVAGNQNLGTTMARYNTDGGLDNSFYADKMLRGNFSSIAFYIASYKASSIAIQPDGKIVMGAEYDFVYGHSDFMRRLTVIGDLDSSFISGKGSKIVLRPDGKIVATSLFDDAYLSHIALLLQTDADGILDNSFAVNGGVAIDFGAFNRVYSPIPALQSDGKIVVACYVSGTGLGKVALLRYDETGALDSIFNTNGIVITELESWEVNSLIIQPDGKILFAGSEIARFNPDGAIDFDFGLNGIVSPGYPTHIALQSDGKIVATGTDDNDFALLRFNEDGTLDNDFGQNGLVTTDFDGGNDKANAIAIQPDGKIVVAGESDGDFAIARYLSGLEPVLIEKSQTKISVINLSPNPATDFLSIEFPENIAGLLDVKIVDANGKLMGQQVFRNGQTIEIGHFPKGIYSLRLTDGERVYVGKFIKQ